MEGHDFARRASEVYRGPQSARERGRRVVGVEHEHFLQGARALQRAEEREEPLERAFFEAALEHVVHRCEPGRRSVNGGEGAVPFVQLRRGERCREVFGPCAMGEGVGAALAHEELVRDELVDDVLDLRRFGTGTERGVVLASECRLERDGLGLCDGARPRTQRGDPGADRGLGALRQIGRVQPARQRPSPAVVLDDLSVHEVLREVHAGARIAARNPVDGVTHEPHVGHVTEERGEERFRVLLRERW